MFNIISSNFYYPALRNSHCLAEIWVEKRLLEKPEPRTSPKQTKSMKTILPLVLLLTTIQAVPAIAETRFKALIVDGQNNHDVWPKSTVMMKQYLEETGLFEVDVERTRFIWSWQREEDWLPLAGAGESEKLDQPRTDPEFSPDFSKYDLVVSNFGFRAADWPEATQRNLERYMRDGGALMIVHAASNPWADWEEFNRMTGLGGWGGRNHQHGPYVYYNDDGEEVRDTSRGRAGAHGPRNEFLITIRDQEHPITRGLPEVWLHSEDECYSRLRGPAENLTVLATAADTPALQEAGRNEPMLMTIEYENARVFHTTLGHDVPAFEGVGFIVTFQRGAEWAVTGDVTQPVPEDFPTKETSKRRPFEFSGDVGE